MTVLDVSWLGNISSREALTARSFYVRPLDKDDRNWVARILKEYWGSVKIVTRGRIHYADELPGFIAMQEDKPVGLAIYRIEGDECEIIAMNSLVKRIGIGSALLNAVKTAAVSSKCKRLWLVTTNDNIEALRFYQKRGLVLTALHRNALDQARRLKPEIPLVGIDGIPLRDEIELEMLL